MPLISEQIQKRYYESFGARVMGSGVIDGEAFFDLPIGKHTSKIKSLAYNHLQLNTVYFGNPQRRTRVVHFARACPSPAPAPSPLREGGGEGEGRQTDKNRNRLNPNTQAFVSESTQVKIQFFPHRDKTRIDDCIEILKSYDESNYGWAFRLAVFTSNLSECIAFTTKARFSKLTCEKGFRSSDFAEWWKQFFELLICCIEASAQRNKNLQNVLNTLRVTLTKNQLLKQSNPRSQPPLNERFWLC
jgi:hypothetical protein